MKVALLSLITRGGDRISESNWKIVSEVLNQNDTIDLLVCAGWTLKAISDIARIQNSSGNSHTTWVAEVGCGFESDGRSNTGFYIIKGKKYIKKTIRQQFAQFRDTDLGCIQNYLDLLADERLFSIENYNIRLIICGENNFLTNPKNRGFKAELRFGKPPLKKVFEGILSTTDIFINPAHTPMGNINKMRKRWEFLSKEERACFFVTNECVAATAKSKCRNYSANLEKRSLQYIFLNAKEKSPEYRIDREKGYKLCSILISKRG